jgi:hypothetical protein
LLNGLPVTQAPALAQGPETAPLSFLSTPATPAADSVGVPSHESLLTTAGSSNPGSTAALDALFAQDAPDNHHGSTEAVDALFALEALGNPHRNERLW